MVEKKHVGNCKTVFSARKMKWPPNAQGPLPGAKTGAQLGLGVASSKGHMAIATQHKAQSPNLALPPKIIVSRALGQNNCCNYLFE